MLIETLGLPLIKAYTTDVQSRDFSAQFIPTTTEPAQEIGQGHVVLASGTGDMINPRIFAIPYSSGGVACPFSLRIWGWKQIRNSLNVWWPFPLVELNCITTNVSGLPGAAIVAGEFSCDTIAIAQNDDGTPRGSLGPKGEIGGLGAGSGTTAFVVCDVRGSQKITFDLRQDMAASCNVLFCQL